MSHNRARSLFALALILGLTGTSGAAVQAQPAGFLSVNGTWITDPTGKAILLRGVNLGGYVYPHPAAHELWDYANLARLGFNVVRLEISWANLQPTKRPFDNSVLWSYLDRDVSYAKMYGLYIVLDMHQDRWAQKFGGDGAPDWTVEQYPASDLGMREAVSDFWAYPSLQDQLVMVWKSIASHYANEPAIAGYDLMNEPMVYTSVISSLNESNVDAYYARTIAAIRAVDPNHLIFLEPANCLYTADGALDNKVVWEPHFYPLSFFPHYYPQNVTELEADMAAKYQKFVVDSKAPMWMGEFGAFMEDGSANDWSAAAKKLFDRYQVGWAWFGDTNSIPEPIQHPVTSANVSQAPQLPLQAPDVQNSAPSWLRIRRGNVWIY